MVATGQEMFREKKLFKVREKSGNFTSSREVLWTYNHHIVHEIEQQADSGFSKKSILFARHC